jgi:5'-methylthioadenosine phosphorylase
MQAGRLAIIGGHSILGSQYAADGKRVDVELDAGRAVGVLDCGSHVVLQRHGLDRYTPAHHVRHVDNLAAIAALGCDRVLALSSVGGLRADVGVGTFLAPDDFVALHTSVSAYDDARGHRVPGFDRAWRTRVVDTWSHAAPAVQLRDGGVYWQTFGPRFETPAEIRYIARFADVVGMTVASECVVARELGLAYAAVCVVDNLANGIGESELTVEEFESGKAANRAAVISSLDALVRDLA